MILQDDRAGRAVRRVAGELFVLRLSLQFLRVMDDDSIVKHRDHGRSEDTIAFEHRTAPDDVVALPLARLAAGIDEGRKLPVNRARDAIGVDGILISIEDLDFVNADEEDSAVPSTLAGSSHDAWTGEFKMNLTIPMLNF